MLAINVRTILSEEIPLYLYRTRSGALLQCLLLISLQSNDSTRQYAKYFVVL